jgi:hypothetical protein
VGTWGYGFFDDEQVLWWGLRMFPYPGSVGLRKTFKAIARHLKEEDPNYRIVADTASIGIAAAALVASVGRFHKRRPPHIFKLWRLFQWWWRPSESLIKEAYDCLKIMTGPNSSLVGLWDEVSAKQWFDNVDDLKNAFEKRLKIGQVESNQ